MGKKSLVFLTTNNQNRKQTNKAIPKLVGSYDTGNKARRIADHIYYPIQHMVGEKR
jgi:hypothetical protein